MARAPRRAPTPHPDTTMTMLGLLSDSHGDAAITRLAVDRLLEAGADLLLHLGDIETEGVLDALAVAFPEPHPQAGQRVPVHVVFGNCDYQPAALTRYAENLGLTVDHPAGRLTIGGKTLVFTHGHLSEVMDRAIADGVDYLLHGHTHLAADHLLRRTRVICPGALTRADPLSSATLVLPGGSLTPVPLSGGVTR